MFQVRLLLFWTLSVNCRDSPRSQGATQPPQRVLFSEPQSPGTRLGTRGPCAAASFSSRFLQGRPQKVSNTSLWCPLVAKRSSAHSCWWLLRVGYSGGLSRDPKSHSSHGQTPHTHTRSLYQP